MICPTCHGSGVHPTCEALCPLCRGVGERPPAPDPVMPLPRWRTRARRVRR